ncbi:hypothetical protein BGZ50_008429 [Haplosporangium sp. Z 11]|nr:hypothetical protein BGZ50_008429 [Haplosporangium sp. Z 11]
MLLRRPTYTLEMITEQLTTDREVQAFSRWWQFSNIVLFDTTGTVPMKGTPMFCIAQKLRNEGFTGSIGNEEAQKRNLNVPAPFPNKPASATSPARGRLHLGSLPTIIKPVVRDTVACQTPAIENPNVNPLFESVRQAMGLNTNITEEVPVRLPVEISLDTIRDRIPTWLLDAIHEETGKRSLAEQFQRVEISEKKRLALLMCPQSIQSGRTIDYSIGAGIEKGLKNRYNNIWPFDHTRVKILEPEDKGDDYINASFVKSPLSRKLYIATQAPLPSTFLDFWTIVWEQNSRVIVMLTRLIEMGRTKCHQYWPTTQHPVMDLGTLRLTFLEEFRPDATDHTILVRRLQLTSIQHPQEPSRTITQIQYTGWPDFGVPETPLSVLKVVQLANAHNNSQTAAGPMVVHCSAGCGRTGAFCVIDSILAVLQSHPEMILPRSDGRASLRNMESSTDVVFDIVNTFREQRLSMVQCLRQYVFCYEAIFWYLAMELTKGEPAAMLVAHKAAAPQNPPSPHEHGTFSSTVADCQGNASITNEEFSFFG